ncbi:MAG: sulfatase [Alphaproteobacteria bacterium]|nr:sulfatase [Alphaproteobacteria bacterium]
MRRWPAIAIGAVALVAAGALAAVLLADDRPPVRQPRWAQPPAVKVRTVDPPREPAHEGTSVLLVTWDTVRADHVSAYGYPRPTTPTFDALAAEGLLFERFIVPQATTLPTHISLFTGLHPEEHGVIANSSDGRRYVVPVDARSLAQHLSAHGYRTAGFVTSTPVKNGSGAERGFQDFGQPVTRDHRGGITVDAAMEWLTGVPEGVPFLLWVHLYDPHRPFVFPRGYERVLPGGKEAVKDWIVERHIPAEKKLLGQINRYDAEIRYVDDQTARLLRHLQTLGRDDDTAVVVVGDHGEGLMQHREPDHGGNWNEQLAAPLAMRVPGVEPRRVATLATAQDVVPTLAALVDWPDEEGLLAQMSGEDVLTAAADRMVISRRSNRQVRLRSDEGTVWTVNSPTHALVESFQGSVLFDLRTDPHQLRQVHDPEVAEALRAALREAQVRFDRRAHELGAGASEELAPGIREELEALGYAE